MLRKILSKNPIKFRFNFLKYNFSKAMIMEKNVNLRISQDKDMDEEIKKEITNVSGNVYLDIRSSQLGKEKFTELFQLLSKSKPRNFRLDLSEVEMDDHKATQIANCIQNWDLKNFDLFMSSLKLSDQQFETIVTAIGKMENLEALHLEVENVNMNRKKRKLLEDSLRKMKNLRDVYINIRRNNMNEEDVQEINALLNSFRNPYFLF